MSGLNDLVRKLKHAVTGADEAPRAAKPFDWEPAAAMPAPAPILKEAPSREAREAAAAAPAQGWKRGGGGAAELPSVVGGSIPADVADFATVYKGAAVHAPQHEYGVDRVAGMLEHKSLAGLDKSVKASAVLAALDAAGVSVKDVIHDGLLRYKALVAFEAAKELELHQLRPRAAQDHLHPAAALANFEHRGPHPLVHVVRLARDLLATGQDRFDVGQGDRRGAALVAVDHATDHVADQLSVFVEESIALRFANLLDHHLLGRLSTDAADCFF